jgi:hypothetical protein
MNMQAATAPGRAYAQMGKDFGDKIGGAIKQYGLNKEKRAKLTGEIEAYYEQNPNAISEIGMSGDEAQDKKDFAEREKFMKGDMSMAQLEGYAGKLARGDVLKTKAAEAESRRIANEMGGLNLELGRLMKDPKVRAAVAEASTAESNAVTADAKASYSDSIASAEYSKKIADADLTRAQTEYYKAKSKAEEKTDSYKPGQRVDIEGAEGNKVSFVWTGNSLQPLNDSVSKRSIDEAIIRGVDPAAMKVYLEDNYDYNEDTELYTFKGKSNMVGYGGGQKDPMMERAITILGMRGQVNDEDLPSDSNKEESAKIEPTIDEHKSANEKAKSSRKMFYIINGEKYKVQ